MSGPNRFLKAGQESQNIPIWAPTNAAQWSAPGPGSGQQDRTGGAPDNYMSVSLQTYQCLACF